MRRNNPHRVYERLAEKRFNWLLPMLIRQNGVLCDVTKVKESTERDVYGHYAGQRIEDEPVAQTLVAGLPVSEWRTTGGGQYGQGYFTDTEALYAFYDDLDEGDVIRPYESDAQFIVTNVSAAGIDGRIKRFNVSSILSGVRPDRHDYPQKLTIG